MQHLTNTNKHPMQKWPKELNRHFSNEEIQKVNKHMKNMLTVVNYYRNANQKYSEVSPHSSQKSERESRSVVSDSLRPHELYSPGNSPDQNTGVGSLFLFQGIFPTQGSNPGLLHCRCIFTAEPQGKPKDTGLDSLSFLQWIVSTQ